MISATRQEQGVDPVNEDEILGDEILDDEVEGIDDPDEDKSTTDAPPMS